MRLFGTVSLRRRVRAYLAVLAGLVVVTSILTALRSVIGLATIALLYLLVVFLSAVRYGWGPGLGAAVLAFLAVNFFFTVPYYTFVVASTEDVITLGAFLLVATMSSRLVARLHDREAEARRQAWEAATLHALSAAVTGADRADEILPAVAARIVETLDVGECAIFLADEEGRLRAHTALLTGADDQGGPSEGSRRGRAESVQDTDNPPGSAVRAFITREPVEEGDALSLPLAVSGHVVGVLHVEARPGAHLTEATERLLRTFADQAAVVIERLRLRREAAEAEALRKTDELKSALLSAVSHDLRTPLASIRVAATALRQDGGAMDDETRRDLLETIDGEATRLSRLVGNLLDLSRIEAGVLRPVKEWHDLSEVVARAVDDMRGRIEDRRLVVDIPPELPLVLLDFTQIEDVLGNLLDNAARHSPEGTEIRITARPQGTDVVVQVENEGPTVPVESAASLFDRFYAGSGSRGRAGLGLAICKGLVEAHGGRIWVERPGEPGARFAFTVPVGAGAAPVGERPQGAAG